jgi:hypothetical protein
MEKTRSMNGELFQLPNAFLRIVIFIFIYHVMCVKNEKGFCEINLFERNKTSLEFTKEINTVDYVVIERYKSLSCCAKGYKTIEW